MLSTDLLTSPDLALPRAAGRSNAKGSSSRPEVDEAVVQTVFDKLVAAKIAHYAPDQCLQTYRHNGFSFRFRISPALASKPGYSSNDELSAITASSPAGSGAGYLPGSDIDFTHFRIQDVGATHVLAINKFSAFRPHLLLLTRDGHRRQWEPLDHTDLTAAWTMLTSLTGEYIVTYNCGKLGGCSRLHKHMQILPYSREDFPLSWPARGKGMKLPFACHEVAFPGLGQAGEDAAEAMPVEVLVRVYEELLRRAEKSLGWQGTGKKAVPHNMVLHRRWMAVIPRRRVGLHGAGANAAGMMGSIWLARPDEVKDWCAEGYGPMEVLVASGVAVDGHDE